MYKCEILADSMNPQGDRITTFRLTYPRIIHAELMTHRMFSRNSASSRAIPFEKMVKMVEEDPFIPIAWQNDHKGMQGTEYNIDSAEIDQNKTQWLMARDRAVGNAYILNQEFGVTKQLCNRLLEPFMWHTVLVTATEYDNFFELRCPQYNYLGEEFRSKKDVINSYTFDKGFEKEQLYLTSLTELNWIKLSSSGADIHIQAIAEMMLDAYNESTPKKLKAGEWHIPFGDNIDISGTYGWNKTFTEQEMIKVKIATARCARISYETLGDNPKIDYEADIKLHDKLIGPPFHASPFEHCAKAMNNEEYETFVKGQIIRVGCEIERYDKGDYSEDVVIKKDIQGWCNNFKGFINYRYLVENEKIN